MVLGDGRERGEELIFRVSRPSVLTEGVDDFGGEGEPALSLSRVACVRVTLEIGDEFACRDKVTRGAGFGGEDLK